MRSNARGVKGYGRSKGRKEERWEEKISKEEEKIEIGKKKGRKATLNKEKQ